PKIQRKVPKLLLDLMNECLDAKQENRPDARILVDKLKQYRQYITNKDKLHEQVEEIEEIENSQTYKYNPRELSYQTHKQAIYTSRHLNFHKLPEPVNA
ncbi:22353_t:CDS:1, partial [Cetraspora pellucida]